MASASDTYEQSEASWRWWFLIILTVVQVWIAHAFAFFFHEFAHSIVAWSLGWKTSPLALHYPPLSGIVFLIQLGINQDVNEVPIFESGRGVDAAAIAAAGMVIGNAALTYPLSRLGYLKATGAGKRGWAMLAYWICVASVGNLIDYVPIRTFTLDGDMGSVQRGLGWSPWAIIIIFGIPAFVILAHFLWRIVPSAMRWLFPQSVGRRFFVASLTVFFLFAFYGSAGLLEGGPTSHLLSILSVFVVLPLAIILELYLVSDVRSRRMKS